MNVFACMELYQSYESPKIECVTVTKSKLILLASWQASKSRDNVLGQGIVTSLGKPADQENGGLVFQRTTLFEWNLVFFYTNRRECVAGCCKLLVAGILCSCSCPHRSGHNVPINLQQDKCYYLFHTFFSLYEWKVIYL